MLCSGEGETGFLGAQRGARSVRRHTLTSKLFKHMVAVSIHAARDKNKINMFK
jgi:hypothetical protein